MDLGNRQLAKKLYKSLRDIKLLYIYTTFIKAVTYRD